MKLGMWKVKVLFKVGRFILVKLVLNGLFLYYMGIFKMLKKVMKKIIKIQLRFFWVGKGDKKGFLLIKWDMI